VLTQRSLADDPSARCVVDYSLARRATLSAVRIGRLRRAEACDAQTYLRRAARYHGLPTDRSCPMCTTSTPMTDVLYAFGESLRPAGNGRARARKELLELAAVHPEISVFVVEVCLDCGWNYLTMSLVLGTGERLVRRGRTTSGSRG